MMAREGITEQGPISGVVKSLFTILLLVNFLLSACDAMLGEPKRINTSNLVEEKEIRSLVEGFGNRLAAVSLQSPIAAEEMKQQYAQFVSYDLLERWKNDPSTAPGRVVSSPWPDRIEITSLTKVSADRYMVNGYVVEVTSMEVVNGGVAAKIPAIIEVQKNQGRWVIADYREER